MPDTRPTLHDIARAAGVSVMSVSRALRAQPNVSEPLRRRIVEIAKAMGYRPDPLVTRLMMHLRSRYKAQARCNLGCLVPHDTTYARNLIKGAETRAGELGYALDIIDLDRQPQKPGALARVLTSRGIEGLLLLPLRAPGPALFLEDWRQWSVVAASYSITSPRFDCVVPHFYINALKAFSKLRDMGAKRPALVMRDDFEQRVNHAYSAALAYDALENGRPVIPPLIITNFSERAIETWGRLHRPDAIVITHDLSLAASSVERVLHRLKTRFLVSLSTDDRSLHPGIIEGETDLGSRAVSLLVDLVDRNEKGVPARPVIQMVEGFWHQPPPPPDVGHGPRARRAGNSPAGTAGPARVRGGAKPRANATDARPASVRDLP